MSARKKFNDATALGQRLHRELLKSQPGFKRMMRLIEAGADIEARNEAGETPLLAAIKRKHTDAAIALINADASLSACDNDRRTPLYHAINTSNRAVMRPLFDMNAPEGFITESLVGQDRWDDYIWGLKESIAKEDAEKPIRLMKKLALNGNTPSKKAPKLRVMNKLKLKA